MVTVPVTPLPFGICILVKTRLLLSYNAEPLIVPEEITVVIVATPVTCNPRVVVRSAMLSSVAVRFTKDAVEMLSV